MLRWFRLHKMRPLIWLVIGPTVSSCSIVNAINEKIVESIEKESTPETQAEAASSHVAVIAIAKWDEYVKDLQPVFSITPADALTSAIPTTASFEAKLVDAIRLSAQLGLPTTGTTSSSLPTRTPQVIRRPPAPRRPLPILEHCLLRQASSVRSARRTISPC